jgi:hypothetical protein
LAAGVSAGFTSSFFPFFAQFSHFLQSAHLAQSEQSLHWQFLQSLQSHFLPSFPFLQHSLSPFGQLPLLQSLQCLQSGQSAQFLQSLQQSWHLHSLHAHPLHFFSLAQWAHGFVSSFAAAGAAGAAAGAVGSATAIAPARATTTNTPMNRDRHFFIDISLLVLESITGNGSL